MRKKIGLWWKYRMRNKKIHPKITGQPSRKKRFRHLINNNSEIRQKNIFISILRSFKARWLFEWCTRKENVAVIEIKEINWRKKYVVIVREIYCVDNVYEACKYYCCTLYCIKSILISAISSILRMIGFMFSMLSTNLSTFIWKDERIERVRLLF